MRIALIFAISLLIGFQSTSQQLFINEVSQGPSGSSEYVEFIVAGSSTCASPPPCLDMRGIVIDDNNGDFRSGSGQGIEAGAMRFANIPFWQCIPQGTIIVIYNEQERNTDIPADDESMTDGNCRLILSGSSLLLEKNTVSPSNSNSNYPNSGWTSGGSWLTVRMANSQDSYQIRQNTSSTSASHAVSWGSNNLNTIIYFGGQAGGLVFNMMNTIDDNPSNQANWGSIVASSGQTPGVPNSPQNAAWISSMNPTCGGGGSAISVSITPTTTGCGTNCTGTATATPSGGVAPYTYLWDNGQTTATANNLCAISYSVTVTDANGCTGNQSVTITSSSSLTATTSGTSESCPTSCDGTATVTATAGASPYTYSWSNSNTTPNIQNLCPGNYSVTVTDQLLCQVTVNYTVNPGSTGTITGVSPAGPFTTDDATQQLTASLPGGTWSANCTNCITNLGIFDPQVAGVGTHQVCYTMGAGACQVDSCISIIVTQGCITQYTTENKSACKGDSIIHEGVTLSTAGSYNFNYILPNGCDSINTVIFTLLDCELPYEVFIPNTFTPNGDNINDLYELKINGAKLDNGYILNRWGEIVKEFTATDLIWDGKTKSGGIAKDGVYTYVIIVENKNGSKDKFHGFISLIR